jgi:histidyl-tRNA synthetase
MSPKAIVRPVKGTRDFYPEQMSFRVWLHEKMRTVSQRFGYQEYEAPILETLELYAAKSGDELVQEQAYVFTDRGGDQITLRPELTPSLARMVAQKQRELPRPIRWWSFGPFWRYERPQKGRTREFFQWNVDLVGVNSPYADAEMVTVLATFFREVGLSPEQVIIKVNHRRLMDEQIRSLGVAPEQVGNVFKLIDKLDKLPPAAWTAYGEEATGLSKAQIEGLRGVLTDRELWRQSDDLVAFFDAVESLGARDYVQFDPSIIRGLAYYTGLVFEAWDVSGEGRAINGGGRYDNLLAAVGGEPVGAVGFAMGDVMIGLVLEKFGLKPDLRPAPAQVLVSVFQPELVTAAARLAAELRAAGLNTELYPEPARLDRQLKYAASLGIPTVLILGPDEAQAGTVTVRDLVKGEQQTVEQSRVIDVVRAIVMSQG